MKKRILMLILVLPIIVVFVAYGVANYVELPTNLVIEKIVTNYQEIEELIYDQDDKFLLECIVFPTVIKNPVIIWEIIDIEEIEPGETPAAQIVESNGQTFLQGYRDCYVQVIARNLDGSVNSKVVSILVTTSSSEAKKIIINQKTNESQITAKYYFGTHDLINSSSNNYQVALASFDLNPRLLPLRSDQATDILVIDGDASVNGNIITFLGPGVVEVEVVAKSNPDLKVSYQFEIIPGINIYNYQQLIEVTKNYHDYPLVMQTNLESLSNLKSILGYNQDQELKDYDYQNLANRGYQLCGNLVTNKNKTTVVVDYQLIKSTYDLRFYEYRQIEAPLLKVGITFNQDVYGNGYTINLHQLTYPSSTAGNTDQPMFTSSDLFQGPLEFISAYGMAVYGQDNIGFLAAQDNITIDNIILMNCNTTNLSHLNYVGTTLEIMADNVLIKGSIIQNGRTVIRSFSNQNLVIDSCLLKYGREFIFKLGSNQLIRSYHDPLGNLVLQPKPVDDDGLTLTDSNALVKDTIFFNSGFFGIGIDAHFSGELLYDASGYGLPNLHLAATSYASILTLEGNCLFYEWKELDLIDGSTLISGVTGDEFFNFPKMVKSLPEYTNHIKKDYNQKNQLVDYIHGGIVLFGGGINYSQVIFDQTNQLEADFNYYSIKISDVGEGIATSLTKAAGNQPFQFYSYPNTNNKIKVMDTPNPQQLAGSYQSRQEAK